MTSACKHITATVCIRPGRIPSNPLGFPRNSSLCHYVFFCSTQKSISNTNLLENWLIYMVVGGLLRALRCQVRYSSSCGYSDRLYKPIISEGFQGIKKITIPKDVEFSNQSIDVENGDKLKETVDKFEAPIMFSFGYGSGVLAQAGYEGISKANSPQVDMIFIVEDGVKFHQKNLQQFPLHYSGMKLLRAKALARFQDIGAGVYFNPFVQVNEQSIKYGTVSMNRALQDLSEWSSLYLAGRLQKPVKFLSDHEVESYSIIKHLNQYNLKNAMALAILLIRKDRFNEVELYETITKISYMGDIRFMLGGENPNKVRNIVSKQFHQFRLLYNPILHFFITNNLLIITHNDASVKEFRKNLNIEAKTNLISKLPINFRQNLYYLYRDKSLKEIAKDENLSVNLKKVIKKLVRFPSFIQMIKGIFSAGIVKSVRYAVEKKIKSWKA